MDDTRDAITGARGMDEETELMNRLASEIEELEQEIKENHAKVKKIEEEIAEIIKIRFEEAHAYGVAKKDDTDAAKLVQEATDVLKEFYTKNNLVLGLTQKQPGQAPPPPPATWEEPYGGKTGESTGIVAILGMIHEDINKDIAKADAEEKEANALFTKTLNALEAEKGALLILIGKLVKSKGLKEVAHAGAKGTRMKLGMALEIVMKKIKDAEPGCDYFTIKYPLRLKDRQIEMDGLLKAQGILSGAQFAKPADPNREIKPGDALLQHAALQSALTRSGGIAVRRHQ